MDADGVKNRSCDVHWLGLLSSSYLNGFGLTMLETCIKATVLLFKMDQCWWNYWFTEFVGVFVNPRLDSVTTWFSRTVGVILSMTNLTEIGGFAVEIVRRKCGWWEWWRVRESKLGKNQRSYLHNVGINLYLLYKCGNMIIAKQQTFDLTLQLCINRPLWAGKLNAHTWGTLTWQWQNAEDEVGKLLKNSAIEN